MAIDLYRQWMMRLQAFLAAPQRPVTAMPAARAEAAQPASGRRRCGN